MAVCVSAISDSPENHANIRILNPAQITVLEEEWRAMMVCVDVLPDLAVQIVRRHKVAGG
jgi:hypothetical protein